MLAQFMLFGALGLITEVVFTSLKRLFAERVFELKGETSLEQITVHNTETDETKTFDANALFVFIGVRSRIGLYTLHRARE